jgi:signal transduction histidine kinase
LWAGVLSFVRIGKFSLNLEYNQLSPYHRRKIELKTKAILLSFLAILIFSGAALAQSNSPEKPEPVVLTDEQARYPLGLYLEILEDPNGKLTIDQVSSPEFDSKFNPSQVETPNYGFTNSVVWVRLHVRNETLHTEHWLLEQGFANMHYVDLYTPLPDGRGYSVKQTGVLRPVTTRDVPYPRIVFNLEIPPASQKTYYLRFQSEASMTLLLTLWAEAAFLKSSLQEQILMGIYYGILIGLLCYNLFLLFSLREASYLYFVIFLLALFFEEVTSDGYLMLYMARWYYYLSEQFYPMVVILTVASIVLFSDTFLELKLRFPKYHSVNRLIMAIWVALAVLSLFVNYHNMALLLVPFAILSLVWTVAAGIISWRGGYRSARFFLLAWLGMLTGIIWVFFVRSGFLPSSLISENGYRAGIAWMAVCWSFALADRINLLKAETENANRNLQDSEHRLSQILDSLPLGVVLYGRDQRPKYINRRTIEILSDPARGIKPDLAAGRTLREAIPYFSLKAAGSEQEYSFEHFPVFDALQGNPAAADDVEMLRGEELVALEIQSSPVLDSDGNVESAVVAIQDITARKRVEAELEGYRRRLEQLVEQRTEEMSAINERLTIEAAQRHTLELSLKQRIEWLSAVNKAHQTMAGVAGLTADYQDLTAKILELLQAALVFIVRWDEKSDKCETFCSSQPGNIEPEMETMVASFGKDSPLRLDIELGRTITLPADQAAALPEALQGCFQEHGIRSAILAPMVARQTVIGVLGVAWSVPAPAPTGQEVDLVERMALDLADLAQDAVLFDQALELATLEERNRLARDLHDSVTQVLFSASLLAEVLPQVWLRDPEQGFERLERLRRLTRGALAEMRTMLLELRPSAVINTPLNDLILQLAEAVTSRSGLQFQLFIEKITPLPEEVHVNFYRIAQEALNNVVKHAQAEQVILRLNATPLAPGASGNSGHEVTLVVKDDGVGYSGEQRRTGQLGIGIMQERAAAIGARLIQESQPGHGTQVTLIWHGKSGNG